MADAGLFIGWGEVVRGREAEAVETFNSTIEYFTGLQSDGTIESFEGVFPEQHGGDLNGFFFVRGDAEKLSALRVDEKFEAVILRAGLIVNTSASSGRRWARVSNVRWAPAWRRSPHSLNTSPVQRRHATAGLWRPVPAGRRSRGVRVELRARVGGATRAGCRGCRFRGRLRVPPDLDRRALGGLGRHGGGRVPPAG